MGIEVHKRDAQTKTFSSTTTLLELWSATECPKEAYFLVQNFVADLVKHVLYGMDVWKPFANETKRRVCDAPEASAAEPKRHKPEGTLVDDESDSDCCVIIERTMQDSNGRRPKTSPARCAGNRAPPSPLRHPYLASAWTAARQSQFASIIFRPTGATA